METIKNILSENRDSVISSIKYTFKVYDKDQIIEKMREFLSFCEENQAIWSAKGKSTTKAHLKFLVNRMYRSQEVAKYGKVRTWKDVAQSCENKGLIEVSSSTMGLSWTMDHTKPFK